MRALVFIFVFLWVTAMSSWLSVPLSFLDSLLIFPDFLLNHQRQLLLLISLTTPYPAGTAAIVTRAEALLSFGLPQ